MLRRRSASSPVRAGERRRASLRSSLRTISSTQRCSPALRLKKTAYNAALRYVYRTRTTEAFTELLTFLEISGEATAGARSVELMVHPGASYAAAETAVVESDWLAARQFPAELINYRQLSA